MRVPRERGAAASARPAAPEIARGLVAAAVVAAVTLVAALIATQAAGVALRDPKGVTASRLMTTLGLAAVAIVVDLLVRAARRSPRRLPTPGALLAVRRERWTAARLATVGCALVCFYVTYLAYRNLKSVVPVLRPGVLFDTQLTDLDRTLAGGSLPATVLHDILGTGFSANALSAVYMAFFVFIPVCLVVALVLATDLRPGLFFTTALALNWPLAAVSYFVLPSIGPFHTTPAAFADLPATAVSHLQQVLLDERGAFLGDPAAAGAAQSIGAFASLHVAIYVTAALAAHLMGAGRVVKGVLWTLTALTAISTVYFGWHYILDDLGGAAIAVASLGLARVLTGCDLRAVRRLRRAPTATLEPA